MKRLPPFRMYSSPSRRASVRIAAESEPEPASVSAYAGSHSPLARCGSQRAFCSSVPASLIPSEPSSCTARIRPVVAQTFESSSTATSTINAPVPVPPYRSSNGSPSRSCSRSSSTMSHGNSADLSISAARGATRARASVRTSSRISRCSSVRGSTATARSLVSGVREGRGPEPRHVVMDTASASDGLPARRRVRIGAIAELLVAALPLIGLVSLLLRSQLDPHFENYRVHFVLFGVVGTIAFVLGFAAGEAANRRGDARVLLLSLAFMATGGFMGLHALGTRGVLFSGDHAGFKVAIPVGLLVSAGFAAASVFVDVRPEFARLAIRYRRLLRATILAAMASWFVWTVLNLPPLDGPNSEAARGSLLAVFAIVGTVVYAVSAARYWTLFRQRPNLLPAAVIACFVLLSEALIGVAVSGERKWHASWWEWHGLIVSAYLIIGFAAHREWRDERFRHLYLSTTRERSQDISVLFADLVEYTSFAARSTPAEAAA